MHLIPEHYCSTETQWDNSILPIKQFYQQNGKKTGTENRKKTEKNSPIVHPDRNSDVNYRIISVCPHDIYMVYIFADMMMAWWQYIEMNAQTLKQGFVVTWQQLMEPTCEGRRHRMHEERRSWRETGENEDGRA